MNLEIPMWVFVTFFVSGVLSWAVAIICIGAYFTRKNKNEQKEDR